jgi:hypothetical protein
LTFPILALNVSDTLYFKNLISLANEKTGTIIGTASFQGETSPKVLTIPYTWTDGALQLVYGIQITSQVPIKLNWISYYGNRKNSSFAYLS